LLAIKREKLNVFGLSLPLETASKRQAFWKTEVSDVIGGTWTDGEIIKHSVFRAEK
jgi:hypothetical protein